MSTDRRDTDIVVMPTDIQTNQAVDFAASPAFSNAKNHPHCYWLLHSSVFALPPPCTNKRYRVGRSIILPQTAPTLDGVHSLNP